MQDNTTCPYTPSTDNFQQLADFNAFYARLGFVPPELMSCLQQFHVLKNKRECIRELTQTVASFTHSKWRRRCKVHASRHPCAPVRKKIAENVRSGGDGGFRGPSMENSTEAVLDDDGD